MSLLTCKALPTSPALQGRWEGAEASPWRPTPQLQRRRQWRQRRQQLAPSPRPQQQPRLPCQLICAAGERETLPQNVGNPVVLPSPDFTPKQCVAMQLEALQANDTPWPGHGIHTMYEFAHDVGGLEPSNYFGFRKDLYHQDNFKGQLRSRLGDLVGSRGYEITGTRQQHGGDGEPESVVVTARVQGSVSGTAALYEFTLRRKLVGPRKGAWTTYSLVAAEA